MKTVLIAVVIAAAIALIWYLSRGEAIPAWEVGGLYSVRDSKHGFRVAKILALDPGVVSVRIYKQTFDDRPSSIDPATLSLGSIYDGTGFGMGHLPIDPETFDGWQPKLILRSAVTEEELEGYQIWKESGGVAFK